MNTKGAERNWQKVFIPNNNGSNCMVVIVGGKTIEDVCSCDLFYAHLCSYDPKFNTYHVQDTGLLSAKLYFLLLLFNKFVTMFTI